MAETAGHVTMLQRTPTYIVALPGEDKLANRLRKVIPVTWAYGITRWKNVLRILLSFQLSRRRPELMKRVIRKMTTPLLPEDFDYDTHLTPPYNPWDQRMCLVPDGDLFAALHKHTVDIVTDHIETFTEHGIKLKSGQELEADIIVTATGLNLLAFGGVELVVDGKPVDLPSTMAYKGIMLSDVPNLWVAIGYTNASWTLKVDLTYEYMWRLIKHLDATGMRQCTPRRDDSVEELPFLDFNSGYVLRSVDKFPKRGASRPWRLAMNYAIDLLELRFAPIEDSAMEFGNPEPAGAPQVARAS
jgi:cation diffusion facilitator CzcD-associated flavoprotein CzcO